MKKKLVESSVIFLLSLGIFFVCFFLFKIPFFQNISESVNDAFTYKILYHTTYHPDDIVIVKIDDATLNSLGKSDLGMTVFDKGVYAKAIQNIFEKYHAAVLGVDVIFANPSVLGLSDEKKLSDVFSQYQDRIVIASRSDYTPHPLCLYNNVQHGIINISLQEEKIRSFPLNSYEYDIQKFCPDEPVYSGNSPKIFLFSREVLEAFEQYTNPLIAEKIKKNLEKFDALSTDKSYIDFYSDGKQHQGTIGYSSYSFADIYAGKNMTSSGEIIQLSNKIVLIGEIGTLMQDSHYTPVFLNKKMSGIEINANILETLKQGRILQDISLLVVFFVTYILSASIIFMVLYKKWYFAFATLFLSMIFFIIFGILLFDAGYIFNIFGALIASIISFFLAYIYKFQVSDKSKRALKKQFSLFVSPDIVDTMSKDPDSVYTKGEKREMSIFFSDIVSFTSIAEKMPPETLILLLNEYFGEMTRIIHQNKGTLDKFIGDAVMCFFNAPLPQENHSYYACKTALQQQKRLQELNESWKTQGFPEIKIRIGLHCGEAIHGNIGSSDTRLSYTIMGDSVNLASRLEGVGKEYDIFICASETIYNLQKDAFHFRELDTIAVKGKSESVKIYQLIAPISAQLPEKLTALFSVYAQALELYRKGEYRQAGEMWLGNKGDPTSRCMARRCKDVLEGKAHVEQGVFIMTHK